MLDYENKAKAQGFSLVIGVDEAGRGPLAGPVVAAAVTLKNPHFKNKICDSKKLSAPQREKAFLEISRKAHVGVGIVSETVIDDKNILEATYHAMGAAVEQLIYKLPESRSKKINFSKKVCLLIDGKYFKTDLPFVYRPIVGGDDLSLSIACASIVAKVTRDRILHAYDKVFPQYGFRSHKGYPTKQHRRAIKKHGLSLIHRKSFKHF